MARESMALENTAENRKFALTLLRSGRLEPARAAYDALLAEAPSDPDLLGLMAVVRLQQGAVAEAETLLARSFEEAAPPRIQLRNLHNLGQLLWATGRGAEARKHALDLAPEWPEGTVADPAERDAVLWLVGTLIEGGRAAEARTLLDRAMPERRDDVAALVLDGRLLLDEDDPGAASEVLKKAAVLAPLEYQPLALLSHAEGRAGRLSAARSAAQRIARLWPINVDPPRPSHEATILVFNRSPSAVRGRVIELRRLHQFSNYPGEVAEAFQDRYRFISAFGDLPDDAWPARLPEADILINNIANSEEINRPGLLERVARRANQTGLPVINHPENVFRTTRLKNAELLAGVPGLVVPKIRHYRLGTANDPGLADEIESEFDYPVILRLTAAHQSSRSLLVEDQKTAVLIGNRVELEAHLTTCGWSELYAIEFVDLKRLDGFYRKIRAVFVGDETVVSKPSIFNEWMVAGWRSKPAGIAFFRANPQTIEECNRITRDPVGELGRGALEVLEQIRIRLPLDVFGVDFEVDREGRVVFFEAGAAMTFRIESQLEPPDVQLPPETTERVDDAFHRLVARKIAAGRGRS